MCKGKVGRDKKEDKVDKQNRERRGWKSDKLTTELQTLLALRRVLTTLFVALISNSGEGIFCSDMCKHFQQPVSLVPFFSIYETKRSRGSKLC